MGLLDGRIGFSVSFLGLICWDGVILYFPFFAGSIDTIFLPRLHRMERRCTEREEGLGVIQVYVDCIIKRQTKDFWRNKS